MGKRFNESFVVADPDYYLYPGIDKRHSRRPVTTDVTVSKSGGSKTGSGAEAPNSGSQVQAWTKSPKAQILQLNIGVNFAKAVK